MLPSYLRGKSLCTRVSDHAGSTGCAVRYLPVMGGDAIAAFKRSRFSQGLFAVVSLVACLALACSPSASPPPLGGEVLGYHPGDPPPLVPAGVDVAADGGDQAPTDDPVTADADGEPLADQPDDSIAPRTPDNKLIIPWMECTAPRIQVSELWPSAEGALPGVKLQDYCLRGLEYWARVTNTTILTTHPENLAGTYEYLMARRPANMRIIGGVSTYTLPGGTPNDTRPYDFADADGWRSIADDARHIASVTGINIVALENEYALWRWHLGEVTIDFNKLRQSLSALRSTGIKFFWYLPSVQTDGVVFLDRQQKSIEFLQAISDTLPDCVFIIGYIGYKDWILNTRTEVTRREIMRDLLGADRLLDYTFATADGYWYWDDGTQRYCHNARDALDEINRLSDAGWACVYPGVTNWITIARQFAEMMAETEP